MVPPRFAAQIGSRDGVIHGFIPGVVGLAPHLAMSLILDAERPFPAGDYHPDRVTLLNTQRLALLAIRHENAGPGLPHRKSEQNPASVRPRLNPPPRLLS